MGAAHPSAKEKKMPILNENDSPQVELSPGFERRELVSGELGPSLSRSPTQRYTPTAEPRFTPTPRRRRWSSWRGRP